MKHIWIVILAIVILVGCNTEVCPHKEGQTLCSICYEKLDDPSACAYCPSDLRCSGDPCKKVDCLPYNNHEIPDISNGEGVSGIWEGNGIEYLRGPEGSYPVDCVVEQKIRLIFKQSGESLTGSINTTITKITNCEPAVPQSLLGFSTVGPIKGTKKSSSVMVSYEEPEKISAADYALSFVGDTLTGLIVTCHSPDKRCTCITPDKRCSGEIVNGVRTPGSIETINWWTGNFTAKRVK